MKTLRDDPPFPAALNGVSGEAGPVSLPVGPMRSARGRWWVWPHLGSLDAPLVAVVWQMWWARGAEVHLTWRQDVVLALSVWLIYLADRLADVVRAQEGDHRTSRHLFYQRARWATTILVTTVTVALIVATPWCLTPLEFGGGLTLLGLAGVYFCTTHHRNGAGWTVLLPKEGAVGALFALGSALFTWCRAESVPAAWWMAVSSFGSLCFLNCALITRWEAGPRDLRDPASLLNAFPGVVRRLPEACAGLAMAAGVLAAVWSNVFLPVALGAGLLWLLNRCRDRMSADTLRVLADVALLTPPLFIVFGG